MLIKKPIPHNFDAILKWFDEHRWAEVRAAFHLQSDEAAGRLATLLA
jgi:hypothetical protein